MTSPKCRTATRSAMSITTLMLCSIRKMVLPWSRIERIRATTPRIQTGLSPPVGSSRRMILGSLISVRMISSMRCWPVDSSEGRSKRRGKELAVGQGREQRLGAFAQVPPFAALAREAGEDAAERGLHARGIGHLDIVENRQVVEQPHRLERAGDALGDDAVRLEMADRGAVDADGAPVGRHEAGDDVEQGALAGAVGDRSGRRSGPARWSATPR